MWRSESKLQELEQSYRASFKAAGMGKNDGLRRLGGDPSYLDQITIQEIENHDRLDIQGVRDWPYAIKNFGIFHDTLYDPRIRKAGDDLYSTTVSWFCTGGGEIHDESVRYNVTILTLTKDQLEIIKEENITHIGFQILHDSYPNGSSGLNVAIITKPEELYKEIEETTNPHHSESE